MAKPPKNAAASLGEFDIIARFFAPLATTPDSLGLRDDCAVLAVPDGLEIVATCDAIVEGVHFRADDPAETIGHKALAVNLSDLAAKGARPHSYLLSLTLPAAQSAAWLEGFAAGLKSLQDETGIALIGGDTTATPGPLSITITALGLVRRGHAVLRRGAKLGDLLYVSGTIGDAHLGLRLLQEPALARSWGLSEQDVAFAVDRYRRPRPPTRLALLMRNCAHAAIDVSDGLAGDIDKLCHASHLGATIDADRVPLSAAAKKAVTSEPDLLKTLITAGDDYEIVLAVPETGAAALEARASEDDVTITAIGAMVAGAAGVTVLDGEGAAIVLDRKGFAHF